MAKELILTDKHGNDLFVEVEPWSDGKEVRLMPAFEGGYKSLRLDLEQVRQLRDYLSNVLGEAE